MAFRARIVGSRAMLSARILGLGWIALGLFACRTAEVRTEAAPKLAAEPAEQRPRTPTLDLERFRPDVDALLKEALARGQSWELLTGLCTTAPKRLSGSAGAEKAVQWAAQAMRDAGLEVRLEPVNSRACSSSTPSVRPAARSRSSRSAGASRRRPAESAPT
jgi:hypothetical protein